jgi:hypothetical protein
MASTFVEATRRRIKVRKYSINGSWGKRIQHAADIQSRIQLLEAQLKELRSEFLEHMIVQGLDRLEVGDFRVTRKVRHNWEYSPELSREMFKVQQSQRWEQSKGLALDKPSVYIALSTSVPK